MVTSARRTQPSTYLDSTNAAESPAPSRSAAPNQSRDNPTHMRTRGIEQFLGNFPGTRLPSLPELGGYAGVLQAGTTVATMTGVDSPVAAVHDDNSRGISARQLRPRAAAFDVPTGAAVEPHLLRNTSRSSLSISQESGSQRAMLGGSDDFFMQEMDSTRRDFIYDTQDGLDAADEIGLGLWDLLKKLEDDPRHLTVQRSAAITRGTPEQASDAAISSSNSAAMSKVVDLGSDVQFIACKKPAGSELSALNEKIVQHQVTTIVDLTAPARLPGTGWLRSAYAPHNGKAKTSSDGAVEVKCVHSEWLKNRPIHLKKLEFRHPGNATSMDVTRLHYKNWSGKNILSFQKMNLLADAVQRHSGGAGNAVMIQDDGKSQNANRLMAFMAARSLIEREMAHTGEQCDNLMLMRALGQVAVGGRAQVGPTFLAKRQDLLDLTDTLQQSFVFKNARMLADQRRALRRSGVPMPNTVSVESLMGLTSLTTPSSSAFSGACAESLEVGRVASFGSAFSLDSDADPVQAPDQPATGSSVVP